MPGSQFQDLYLIYLYIKVCVPATVDHYTIYIYTPTPTSSKSPVSTAQSTLAFLWWSFITHRWMQVLFPWLLVNNTKTVVNTKSSTEMIWRPTWQLAWCWFPPQKLNRVFPLTFESLQKIRSVKRTCCWWYVLFISTDDHNFSNAEAGVTNH